MLRVEWTEATATQDPCNRSGGATRYEVDVLRHVQNGNTLSTVPFNVLEYPRNVEISLLETSVTGLGRCCYQFVVCTITTHNSRVDPPNTHTFEIQVLSLK